MSSNIKKYWLVGAVLGLLIIFALLNMNITQAAPPNKPVKVFIMLGQSNMLGSGGQVSNAPETWRPLEGVLYDETVPGEAASISADWEQIGLATTAMGPEMSFAANMRDSYPDHNIAIVKVSKQATGLSYWRIPGNEGHDTLMSRIDVIKDRLDQSVLDGDIPSWSFEGIVSVQGENEADGALVSANSYKDDFEDLIYKIRDRAGNSTLPAVASRTSIKLDPAISAGGPVEQPQLDIVRSSQQEWAESQIYNNWVNTDDLMLIDNWHYGSYSQLTLGDRIAKAWFDIAEQRPNVTINRFQANPSKTASTVLEYQVNFSKPISGFESDDVTIIGETGASAVSVTELAPNNGTVFKVSVSGMQQSGIVDIKINQSRTVSLVASLPNLQSISDDSNYIFSPNNSISDLLLYDPITNTPRPLKDLTSGFGWDGRGWQIQNNLTNGYLAQNSSLTYSGLLTNVGKASGGENYQTSGRYVDLEKTFRPYMTSVGSNAVDMPGTVLWMSYLVKPESNTVQRFALLRNLAATYSTADNMFTVEQSGGKWALRMMSRNLVLSDVNVTLNNTYLMVVRLEIGGPSALSRAHLWVNPDLNSLNDSNINLSSATISDESTDSNFKFRRINWYPGNAPGHGSLDEIRMGTTFSSVTPTAPEVPSSPTIGTATAGNGQATVTFTPPVSDGGSPITGYTVVSSPAGGVDTNAGSTGLSHVITGLTNGQAYTFTVVATNAAGTSSASASSNSITPTAPVATTYTISGPSFGDVNAVSGDFTITPNDPYTGTITISPSGPGSAGLSNTVLTFNNSATAQTFSITPTVAGAITLTPTNSGSLSNPSNLTYTSNAVAPQAPTITQAVVINGKVYVRFDPPQDNGGSPITTYSVVSYPAGATDINNDDLSTDRLVENITSGTTYKFKVKATNAVGDSLESDFSNEIIITDQDLDGIDDLAENATANGGDANNDGILDSLQDHVASFINPVTNKTSAIEIDPTCSLADVTIKEESSLGIQDNNYTYPLGLYDFVANCGTPGFTTAVKLFNYETPQGSYITRKFNPTTNVYSDIVGAYFQDSIIAGLPVKITNYNLTDGSANDADGIANGTIVDPVGLAINNSTSVASPITTLLNAVGAPNTGLGQQINNFMVYVLFVTGAFILAVILRYKKYQK